MVARTVLEARRRPIAIALRGWRVRRRFASLRRATSENRRRSFAATLRTQPLLVPAISIAAGLLLFASAPTAARVTALLVGTASVAALLRRRGRATPLLVGAPFVLGVVAATPPEYSPQPPAGPAMIEGVIRETPRPVRVRFGAPYLKSSIDVEAWNGGVVRARIPLYAPSATRLGRGDRIRFSTWIRRDDRALRIDETTPVEQLARGRGLGEADRARHRLRSDWQRRFDSRTTGWLAALLLGDRALLPARTPHTFRAVGQSHLLAISGLHVGIVMGLAAALLRPLLRRPMAQLGILLPLLLGCAAIAGGDPPVVRAVFFGAIGAVAAVRGERGRTPHHLAVTFVLLVAWRGSTVLQPSFLFSFCAVAGIALWSRRNGGRAWWSRSLRVSLGAWLGVSVPLAWFTPSVVYLSPFFSLAFVPLLTALLATGMVAALVGSSLDPIAAPLLAIEIELLEGLAGRLDRLPGTPGQWPPLPPAAISLAILSLFAVRRARIRLASFLIAGAIGGALAPSPGPSLSLIDVGHGQAALLRGAPGAVLFDAGSLRQIDGGANAIARELHTLRDDGVDALFVSHPHADHLSALFLLPERIRIGRVFVGPRFDESDLGAVVLAHLARTGVRVETVAAGDRVDMAGFRIDVLHPPRNFPAHWRRSVNDDSLVLHVRGRGLELLLPGDIETIGQAIVPARRGELVLLPHHGASTPGLAAWISRVAPREILVSRGGRVPARTRDAVGTRAIIAPRRRSATRWWLSGEESGWRRHDESTTIPRE